MSSQPAFAQLRQSWPNVGFSENSFDSSKRFGCRWYGLTTVGSHSVSALFCGAAEHCDIELQPEAAPLAADLPGAADKVGTCSRLLRIRISRMR
jgi:hypothetical protein